MDKPAKRYLFDPEQMTPEERYEYLVDLLADGVLRLFTDDLQKSHAPCGDDQRKRESS